MNSFVYKIYLVVFCFVTINYAAKHNSNNLEVYTSEDIRSLGIITLNDLFDLSTMWTKSSINGYTSRVSGSYLSTYQRQNFIVLVNNQKIQLSFLDEQNIDLLPFTPDQIDTVIFVNEPINYKGYFAESGLIDIILKSPENGFSIETMQSIGNKTGDPGPFAYTEYRTPNVDKLGYVAGVNVKSKGTNWRLLANLKYSENFVTDPELERRILPLSTNQKARLLGTSLNLSYSLLGGEHSVLFAFSQDEDFFYFPRFGSEVPSNRIFRHIGLSGYIPLSPRLRIHYQIIKGINELARSENSRNLNFNLKVNSTTLNLASEYKGENFTGYTGLTYEKHDANRTGYGNDEQINLLRLNVNFNYIPTSNIVNSAGLELNKNENFTRKKTYYSSSFGFSKFNTIQISASFAETGINEELNYYTWVNNGVQILDGVELENDFIDTDISKQTFTAQARYEFSDPNLFQFYLSGFVRNFDDFYIENYIYNFSSDGTRIVPFFELTKGESLKVIGGSGEISFNYSQTLSNKIEYVYQHPFEGTDNFMVYWKRFSEHKLYYTLDYKPVKSFKIWMKLNYISRTVWREFIYLSEQSNNLYNYRSDSKLLMDISLQKTVWKERLWINLLFKNIFNQKDYSYPIGVNMGLRFYLIAQLQLKSLFE